jgi:single-stranded DNA-binding protein
MNYDKIECSGTGSVEGFQIINTKTGTPMIKFFLLAGKEKVSVVAFHGLADQTRLAAGQRVAVTGNIQSTSYRAADGVMRYGFQIVAHEITADLVAESDAPAPPPKRSAPAQPYQGGPF